MWSHYVKNRRILFTLLLGFSCGLPVALTGATLQAWFTQSGVSVLAIGALSLIGLPYTFKFLWSPLLDRFALPFLGRRRDWIFATQVGLCIALFAMAHFDPGLHAAAIGAAALTVAFIAASQDIAIDAYRTDLLLPDERGLGTAGFIFAYRMATLTSGGLALLLADRLGWRITYEIMAILVGLSTLTTYLAPSISDRIKAPATLAAAIIEPFKDFFKRKKIIAILLFILLYKFGDAFALSLMSFFLLKGLGFSLTAVGVAHKTFGLFATITGAFVGGILMTRLSIWCALLLFGILQAFSNLFFMFLAIAGKSYLWMVSSIFIEAFCSGMGTAAFVAFIMSICHHQYTATQFAFLSSFAALGIRLTGPLAAFVSTRYGWVNFYALSFLLSLPGLLLLIPIWNKVEL